MRRRLVVVAVALGALVVLLAPAASAHPLGNFTINGYAGLRVAPDHVLVDYVLDLAEIPAYQHRGEFIGTGATGSCEHFAQGLDLRLDGRRAALGVVTGTLSFPAGQGGVPTLRLECVLSAHARGTHLTFTDPWYAGRLGWHEITAVGDGTTLSGSDAPTSSVSQRLTRYPKDLLRSPLHQRSVSISVRAGGPAAPVSRTVVLAEHVLPGPVARATSTLAGLAEHRRITALFALAALAVAVGLGALHALAPGHAKTVLAAYLVGEQGTLRQGLVIAGTVTATHTVGVLALGVALSTSTALAPEQLYPWLASISGVLVVLIGVSLLRRAVRRSHEHPHHHEHPHAHERVQATESPGLGTRRLVTLGFAGGLVPSPSALVVLLGAIALGRAWFGVLLVVAYGAGMALTLVGAGLLLAHTRRRLTWHAPRALASVPLVAAAMVIAAGSVVLLKGVGAIA